MHPNIAAPSLWPRPARRPLDMRWFEHDRQDGGEVDDLEDDE